MTERDIFDQVLEIDSPEERTAFLDEACGDDAELRTRVEELLRSHDDAGKRTFSFDDGGKTDRSVVDVQPTTTPKRIDVSTPRAAGPPQSLLGIYELEGDDLKICLADPGEPRPTSFEANGGDGCQLFVFRRDGTANSTEILLRFAIGSNEPENVVFDGRPIPDEAAFVKALEARLATRPGLVVRMQLSGKIDTTSWRDGAVVASIGKMIETAGGRVVGLPPVVEENGEAWLKVAEQFAARHNQLKQIGVAFANHESHRKILPPGKFEDTPERFDPDGRPYLSWRVHILPYLGHQELYGEFRLDEPWDSPQNAQLLDLMPSQFRTLENDDSRTTLLAVVGDGTVYEGRAGRTTAEIAVADGLSNTALVVDAGRERAVPWTKPEDLPLDAADPIRAFGTSDLGNDFLALMADGAVKSIPYDTAQEQLRNLFLRADGNAFDPTEKRRTPLPSAPGWTPLFNGRDLAGWKTHENAPGEWKVEDGILVGPGTTGFLFSEDQYDDFHLRAEVRINGSGDGGLLVRAPFRVVPGPKEGDFFVAGAVEVQITGVESRPQTGTVYSGGWLDKARPTHAPNEWFTLETIVVGDTLRVLVDGQQVTTAKLSAERGHLALQNWIEEGIQTVLEFRKIEILELDEPGEPKVPASAKVSRFEGYTESVTAIAFTPDGGWIVTGAEDETLRVWDVATGKQVATLDVESGVRSIAVSPDGDSVAAGLHDGSIVVWNPAAEKIERKWAGHVRGEGQWRSARVLSVAFSPDGTTLASGGDDRTVRLWKLADGAKIAEFAASASPVESLVWSSDGTRLFAGEYDGTVSAWNLETRELVRRSESTEKDPVRGRWLALAPDDRRLVTGYTIRDPRTFEPVGSLEHEGRWEGLISTRFSGNGALIVAGSESGHVRVWNAATGREVARLPGAADQANTVAVSLDGRTVAFGGGGRWNDETRQIEKTGDYAVRVWSLPESVWPDESNLGWTPLFNGRDLSGWKSHPMLPGGWTVEDGVLVGRREGAGVSGYLFTERDDFEDFHLRAEARVNDTGNGGIFFRAPLELTDGPVPHAKGYEAQILNGTFFNPGGRRDRQMTGSLFGLARFDERLVEPDEWSTLEVIARVNRLIVKVNGRTPADHTDGKRSFTKGHLALQIDAGSKTVVEFRRIEVRDASDEGP